MHPNNSGNSKLLPISILPLYENCQPQSNKVFEEWILLQIISTRRVNKFIFLPVVILLSGCSERKKGTKFYVADAMK